MELQVKLLTENGRLPTRATPHSAGYDLFAAADAVVPGGGMKKVSTGISIAFPLGFYGRISARSGLTLRHRIDVGAGVIDADYRGEIGVILFNHSTEDFKVSKGDRIAQLILEAIITPEVVQVDSLPETERGSGGFGSTGTTEIL